MQVLKNQARQWEESERGDAPGLGVPWQLAVATFEVKIQFKIQTFAAIGLPSNTEIPPAGFGTRAEPEQLIMMGCGEVKVLGRWKLLIIFFN